MMQTNLYIDGMAGIVSSGHNGTLNAGEEPDYKTYIPDAGLRRRMSRLIKMGVTSSLMAIENSGEGVIDGIITGTGWGCLTDTEKFLVSIYENSERLLNPSSFIQSTSNTIGAQIALMLDSKHYNNTFVHGGSSFECALLDSSLLLSEGKKRLLVGGFDELTPTKSHLFSRMGVWKDFCCGEGAHFFVASASKSKQTIGKISAIEILSQETLEEEIVEKCSSFLNENGLKFGDLQIILNGIDNLAGCFENLNTALLNFKEECGEYPTSGAYALFRGLNLLSGEKGKKHILIVNRYIADVFTFLLIEKD